MEDLDFALVALDAHGGAGGVLPVWVRGDAEGSGGDGVGVSSLFLGAREGEEDGGHFVGAGAVELHGGGNGGGFPCRGVLGSVEGLETPG